MTLKERAKKLKQDIPTVFLSLKDKETPMLAKIMAGITIGYALSPIDLIPNEVWERNSELARGMWQNGKPKKWYYVLPIILIWLLLIGCILKVFL